MFNMEKRYRNKIIIIIIISINVAIFFDALNNGIFPPVSLSPEENLLC